jgi:hypothetical protein
VISKGGAVAIAEIAIGVANYLRFRSSLWGALWGRQQPARVAGYSAERSDIEADIDSLEKNCPAPLQTLGLALNRYPGQDRCCPSIRVRDK